MMKWIYLFIAIIAEIIGTSALKESDGFNKLMPSIVCILGYIVTFYFLSLTIRELPIGITYALWSAIGIVLLSAIGHFYYHEPLDLPAIVGISFIIIGVIIINLFSNSVKH